MAIILKNKNKEKKGEKNLPDVGKGHLVSLLEIQRLVDLTLGVLSTVITCHFSGQMSKIIHLYGNKQSKLFPSFIHVAAFQMDLN